MNRKRFAAEQIISLLKEAEAGLAVKELSRKHSISDATFYREAGLSVPKRKRRKGLAMERQPLVLPKAPDQTCL